MKIAIMQPYLFPYIGYFQLINAVDKFIIYDDVNYIKNGWINRNRIAINGQAHYLTVPLEKASPNKKIFDHMTVSNISWRKTFLKQIKLAYGRAENFEEIFNMIERIISNHELSITRIIVKSIMEINSLLEIKTEIIETSSIYNNSNLKGEERIIDICLKERVDCYINPIGGMEIYNNGHFNEKNIELKFLKTGIIKYPQFNKEFISNLSIIDVLMHNNKSLVRKFLNEYELIST